MSGRDYRAFLSNHRVLYLPENKETASIAVRLENGMKSNKYKEVDYDKLRSLAQEKRFAAQASLVKVKKLQQMKKDSKEQSMLKQHRRVWQTDMLRLSTLHERLEADIDAAMRHAADADDNEEDGLLVSVVEGYRAKLEKERQAFQRDTVEPLHLLRQDLQYWVTETLQRRANSERGSHHRHGKAQSAAENLGDPEAILSTLESVKQQQQSIMEMLSKEEVAIMNELESDASARLLPAKVCDQPAASLARGIPEEAFDLDCPDEELKVSLLQEFLLLDHDYCQKLLTLDEGSSSSDGRDSTGAGSRRPSIERWSAEDSFAFSSLVDSYPHDLPERRQLYIDRLLRQWPHSSRQALLEHETQLLASRARRDRRKAIINDWSRARTELFFKVKAAFMELCAARELQEAQLEHQQKQRQMCQILYDKVRGWRQQKLEAMLLEQEILLERSAEAHRLRAELEEKEMQKRNEDKTKVESYRRQQAEQRKEKEELGRLRLEALKENFVQQAAYDRERVAFREAELQRRLEEQQLAAEARATDDEERERRLEALRETVRISAESDPVRLLRDTESWQHKRNEEVVSIQKPLFDIHTFTEKQITSDARVRLEERLREAGLHNTDYARLMLAQTRGPQAPRRDAASTLKLE